MKANWTDHVWHRNCLLNHVTERKLEGRRRGKRRRQLLDDLEDKRRYWKVREEISACSLCTTRFGRSHGVVTRLRAERPYKPPLNIWLTMVHERKRLTFPSLPSHNTRGHRLFLQHSSVVISDHIKSYQF